MRYLIIAEVLIYLDGPQLMIGKDGRDIKYICLGIPNGKNHSLFIAVQVTEQMLEDYFSENVDLRFVFKRPKKNKYFIFNYDESVNGKYPLTETDEIDEDWLPEAGFFARNHTESIENPAYAHNAHTLNIDIDGRWDFQDLSQFPNKYADTYSFLYALACNSESDLKEHFEDIFNRYPWRGGYSTVCFYNDLYAKIPRKHRLAVKEIQYASPGTISLTALPRVTNDIQQIVEKINSNWTEIKELYNELQSGMSQRNLLGNTHFRINLSHNDIAFLRRSVSALCKAIRFDHLEMVHEMTDKNWLASSKLIASFYRRVSELAEFYESGKASFSK
jgi:hypothetical protein